MYDHVSDETTCEKDLVVHADNELKFHGHSSIDKNIKSLVQQKDSCCTRDKSTIPLNYKSMLRPRLDYDDMIWGPFYKEDIRAVEFV